MGYMGVSKSNMKKGFKTSEFYVVLAGLGTVIWGFAQQNCDLSADKLLGLAGALVSAVYAGSRVYLKSKEKGV